MKKQINKGVTIDDTNWCNAAICIAKMSIFDKQAVVNSIQCDNCQEWNHYKRHLCLFEDEYPSATEDQKWSCWKCEKDVNTAEQSLVLAEEKLRCFEQECAAAETEFKLAKEKVESSHAVVKQHLGRYTQMFEESLEKLGVDLLAYHSGSLVGNHVHKILTAKGDMDGPAIITGCLQGDEELRKNFYKILTQLGEIFKLTSAARFLFETEIDDLENMCHQLEEMHIAYFPHMTITPKMHILTRHVPEFARKYKTVGLMSEQGLESLHAECNSITRLYKVRGDERSMRGVQEFHELAAAIENPTAFVAKKRQKKYTSPIKEAAVAIRNAMFGDPQAVAYYKQRSFNITAQKQITSANAELAKGIISSITPEKTKED